MKRLITTLAFLTSLATALVVVGGGLALLIIRDSGERGSGALLALCGVVAFAFAMVLVYAREGAFSGRVLSAGAIAAGILGAMPVAALAYAAIRFADYFPLKSPVPIIDWTAFVAGILLALGALAIVALGYWRSQEGDTLPVVHMQQIRNAQEQLHAAFEQSAALQRDGDADDEVRVTRV